MAKEKEEKKDLAGQLKEIERLYGKNSAVTFNSTETEQYDIIPTGSLQIDYMCLGIGGVARKKLYQIRGWQGANKSTLCAHLAAECQKQGGTVVYGDGELAFDRTYFEQLGVKMDKTFILVQPDYGEQGFDIIHKLMQTGEVALVIIDSDSALLPKSMMEGEMGQQSIGKKAKMNSETYPKIKVAAGKHNVAVCAIAQYRMNPGTMYGDPRTIPGGHALDYWSDCIIELTKKLKKEGDETSGTITTVKTIKNKMYLPYKSVEVHTIFGFGLDKDPEVIDLAIELDIIVKSGSWFSYDGSKIGQGRDSVDQFIHDNPELLGILRQQVIEKVTTIHNNNTPQHEPTTETTDSINAH
jgi:recombination protein RecA